MGFTGQGFSPEDIHELLGAMGDEHHHHREEDHHSNSVSGTFDDDQHHVVTTYVDNSSNTSEDGKPISHINHHHNHGSTAAAAAGATTVAATQESNSSHPTTSQAPVLTTSTSVAPGTSGKAENNNLPEEEAKLQARSERKRCREKQRRSDVNKQFADLTQLLQRIDAEEAAAASDEGKESSTAATSRGVVTFNPSNRVDLIAKTIMSLERLHECSKKRKLEIASLQQQLEEAKKAGEDTAAKLKEAMLAPPGPPGGKQVRKQRLKIYVLVISCNYSH